MGRTSKKGVWAYTKDGFEAVRKLDNGNIYGVMLSEMVSNIFKEGMWFKALTPYMLILTNNDAVQVGNMLTLNGLTRALVGVTSGRMFINQYGVDAVWVVTGFVGLAGIMVNVICLCRASVASAYFLNFVWAIYNGLWNSCLETSWARSIVRSKREDVNGARQITNKVTTSMGPLFSAFIFLACGNSWNISLVQNVMLFGTGMTLFTVMLSFCFKTSQEVEQNIFLHSVRSIIFSDSSSLAGQKEFLSSELRMDSFQAAEDGCVKLTYPIRSDDNEVWASQLQIVTEDFKETNFILAKQYHCTFSGIEPSVRTAVLVFEDQTRSPERVELRGVRIFLSSDGTQLVNRELSELHFAMSPLTKQAPARFYPWRVLSLLICGRHAAQRPEEKDSVLRESLLPQSESQQAFESEARDLTRNKSRITASADEERAPNMTGANVIVVCDVLNALGAGFSLKFMDLFLKVDYGVMPATVFMVAFLQNIFGAWLTPYAKALLSAMRDRGYRAKLGVVMLWSGALFFLGLIMVPGMPLWVVIPSIVLMQSLNSCTRAYNRATLVNYLPREKIATYMSWDALNKANQGGVAIFGAQVVAFGGYRACFAGTFIILSIRTLIYLAYTLRKGTLYRQDKLNGPNHDLLVDKDVNIDEMNSAENIRGCTDGDEDSQLFKPAEAFAARGQERRNTKVQVVDFSEVFPDPSPQVGQADRASPLGFAPAASPRQGGPPLTPFRL